MEAQEEQKLILISQEDVKNVRDFFGHFNIKMPEYLANCLDSLEKKDITEAEHKMLKSIMARAILESEHEIFKDSLFDEVHPKCEKEWFEAQFRDDFETAMDKG